MTVTTTIRIIRNTDDREHPGLWAYRVPEFGIEGRSRQPLLDACRQIQRMGGDPSRVAVLFREGREDWDIRCLVEAGAKTTVEDPDRGRIRFRPFKEFVVSPAQSMTTTAPKPAATMEASS